ncbi:MAG TPA: hypothetical protein VJW76_13550 [Verrucomicrobiae bacterium]|nr:hypothetical protein [Verrucomicrobiae bacterium]
MRNVIVGAAAVLFLFLSATVRAQNMKLGEVLIFHAPDLKPDADARAFEAYILGQLAPAWKMDAPGMELHLVRKDRGNHKGRYVLVYTTDTLERRKAYASATSEVSPFTAALLAKVGNVQSGLAPFVNSDGQYIEYHLVGPEKVAAMPEVDVLGVHYLKVRPDRREAFDRFIAEKLHAAVGNLRPELRLLYYKPVRGADEGDYLTLFALTRASRDKYWPNGQDSDDLKAAFKPVQALTGELKSYLVEGSYATGNLAAAVYESREWADWVQVRAEGR